MRLIYRFSLTLLAIFLGVAIIFGLTFFGKKTQGPLKNAFTDVGDMVRNMEDNAIIKNRTGTRMEKLNWLNRSIDSMRLPHKILLGAYDENAKVSFKSIFELEELLHTTFPLIQVYTAWGDKDEQKFPKIEVESILKSGSIPVITWEPWLAGFNAEDFPEKLRPVEIRDKNGMNDVAKGLYDSYIHEWAQGAAKIGSPIFLRFGHEMNDPYRYPWGPQNNTAKAYCAAWRHIHQILHDDGATNVLWVWSPHPAYGWFNEYYPGDGFVDWVSVGVLNYGTVASWSQWWSFDEIFGKHYRELAWFGKSIMISEFGSLAVGGNREEWYDKALSDLPNCYPKVRAVLFFHFSNDKTTTQQPLDWTIKYDSAIIKMVANSIKKW